MASVGEDLNLANLGEIEAYLTATQVELGVSYFDARRELWLNSKKRIPRPEELVDSITKLDNMVGDSRALQSDRVWDAGLGKISKRLMDGGRLKHNLPMHLLIKILYAGWVRDGTWPSDTQAPESDDTLTQTQ